MGNRLKQAGWALLILALAVGVFAWLKATRPVTPSPAPAEKVWPVAVQTVTLETLRPQRAVFARVVVPQPVRIQAPFTGWVETVAVQAGDRVAPGALLVAMDERDARMLLAQARADVADLEAQLQLARRQLETSRSLAQRKLADTLTVDQHRAQVAQLEARLEKARARLRQTQRDAARARMTAPTALRIVETAVQPGERVAAGQLLLRAYAPETLELEVTLPQRVWQRVAARAETLVLTDGKRSFRFRRMAGERSPLGVTLWFEAPAEAVAGDLLSLTLQLPPEAEVAAVPYSALYGTDRVYVVVDGRLRQRAVQWLGERIEPTGTRALVRGLQSGEQVMITHLPNAIDGLKVEVAAP